MKVMFLRIPEIMFHMNYAIEGEDALVVEAGVGQLMKAGDFAPVI